MGNPIVHCEIGCRDGEKTKQFYSGLFGWTIEQMGPAGMITTGAGSGIGGHITALGHEPHHYVTVYAEVDDLDATDLRHVLGIGLRLDTPLGPFRLEYGHKLDREEGESSGEFFVAIGAAF